MSEPEEYAVVVRDLYKSFRLPHEQSSGVKQTIVNLLRRPSKRIKGYETQHVLSDISFEIKKGEFFGIVGRNGSGKSTLLKLLAGIYVPDKGLVQVNGSLTPFIELGVGFNPELTGRENVYLNGALLGFSRLEMDDMYDDIVTFAEIERFMDQKLKNYSSGMQVRLAFSIAIRARSDILLIDEVLAVGDAAFQQKCFDYFEQLKRENRTIILVSHDMDSVRRFCTKGVLLDKGRIVEFGDINKVTAAYSILNRPKATRKDGLSEYTIENVESEVKEKKVYIDVQYKKPDPKKEELIVGISLVAKNGMYIAGFNNSDDKTSLESSGKIRCIVDISNLLPGDYLLNVSIYSRKFKLLAFETNSDIFVVEGEKTRARDGYVLLNTEWV